jgi:hypothetical protein
MWLAKCAAGSKSTFTNSVAGLPIGNRFEIAALAQAAAASPVASPQVPRKASRNNRSAGFRDSSRTGQFKGPLVKSAMGGLVASDT